MRQILTLMRRKSSFYRFPASFRKKNNCRNSLTIPRHWWDNLVEVRCSRQLGKKKQFLHKKNISLSNCWTISRWPNLFESAPDKGKKLPPALIWFKRSCWVQIFSPTSISSHIKIGSRASWLIQVSRSVDFQQISTHPIPSSFQCHASQRWWENNNKTTKRQRQKH